MSLIVDASVAVKWVAQEHDSAAARSLYVEQDGCIAPVLIIAEVGNALWKKTRQGLITSKQFGTGIDRLPLFLARLFGLVELAPRAAELADRLKHPIYDCFYLALAERERVPVVSADRKLLAAAGRLGTIEARALA